MAEGLTHPIPETGIVHDLPFEQYLATRGRASKSSLWTLHTRSPAHARIEKEESNAMKLGTAIHCAILEPDEFNARFVRGPDDRRGNKWKEAVEDASADGMECLTSGDYDAALACRDALQTDPFIRKLTGAGTVREVSAFWTDEETGVRLRCRPDAFSPALGIIADLKTTGDARPGEFVRRVGQLGYHMGEAIYSDGWRAAGQELAAFVFLAVEPDPPFAHHIFELDPTTVEEGQAVFRAALRTWAECEASGRWPAYPAGVQPLRLNKWDFRITSPAGE